MCNRGYLESGLLKTGAMTDMHNQAQRKEVLRIMADGRWYTLMELERLLGRKYIATSISARIRDFRKAQYGGYRVERRSRNDSMRTFEYRLLPPAPRTEARQEELFGASR